MRPRIIYRIALLSIQMTNIDTLCGLHITKGSSQTGEQGSFAKTIQTHNVPCKQ